MNPPPPPMFLLQSANLIGQGIDAMSCGVGSGVVVLPSALTPETSDQSDAVESVIRAPGSVSGRFAIAGG